MTSHTKRYVQGVLGARRQARAGAVLSGGPSADLVRRGRARLRAVVGGERQRRVGSAAPAVPDAARRGGAAGADGADHRQGRAAAAAADRAARRGPRQRGLPAPERVLAEGPRLQPGAAGRDDEADRPLRRPRGGRARSGRRAGRDRRRSRCCVRSCGWARTSATTSSRRSRRSRPRWSASSRRSFAARNPEAGDAPDR